jgi:ABC-2 type transport system ATP-binding protein
MAMADVRAYDVVRDAVADLGLPLIRIEQRRHRLEDLFRDDPIAAEVLAEPAATAPAAGPDAGTGPGSGPASGAPG